ncbi:MAG: response regulator [Ignavibacterium sp.]|nr:response regulator [Ignavibacterium sp.]MCX7612296.1 response regulator [Ignavibacterium sp.]MDW8374684.1 response regulator [Ignavibacteriales bacterium]
MMSLESILVVDDDINLCQILSDELSDVGYKTHFLTGGKEALEYLEKNSVDLLLLDLNMPGVDGFDVLKELSKKEKKPKVIVLTAYADVKSAIESAKLGANDFLSKPYDFDELLITIRKVLQSD